MTFDLTSLWLMFGLGAVAGLVAGAVRWRSALEEAQRRIEYLEALEVMHAETSRIARAQAWYDCALLGDELALQWLGASAGLVTVFNQPAFATVEARKRAADLYRDAVKRMRGRV